MKRILIVDDSATNLQFVENILKDKFKLALAKSGERAIRYLEKNQVDLILLDLMMPEMDGFETFETKDPEIELFDLIEMLRDENVRGLLQRLRNRPQSDFRRINGILDLLDKEG